MKSGLIVEGGGMKCAYSAGVLDGFLDEDISFDYCIGISAGAANAVRFLAGQRGRNLRFYTEYSDSPKYFGVRSFLETGNLFGLDYIYGELSTSDGKDPVDYEALMANPCEFECAGTDVETGRPRYFTKLDMTPDDFSIIKATSAIPVASKPVEVFGGRYYDGGVSVSIPIFHVEEDIGCDRVVVLLSKPRDYRMKPQGHKLIYDRWLRDYPEIIRCLDHRHEVYNAQLDEVKRLEDEGRAIVFYTPEVEEMSTYSTDPKLAMMLYKSGLYDCGQRAEEIKEFLKTDGQETK